MAKTDNPLKQQRRIAQPEVVLPQVIATFKTVTRAPGQVGEEPPLRALFRAALQARHLVAFQTALEEQRQQQEPPRPGKG